MNQSKKKTEHSPWFCHIQFGPRTTLIPGGIIFISQLYSSQWLQIAKCDFLLLFRFPLAPDSLQFLVATPTVLVLLLLFLILFADVFFSDDDDVDDASSTTHSRWWYFYDVIQLMTTSRCSSFFRLKIHFHFINGFLFFILYLFFYEDFILLKLKCFWIR